MQDHLLENGDVVWPLRLLTVYCSTADTGIDASSGPESRSCRVFCRVPITGWVHVCLLTVGVFGDNSQSTVKIHCGCPYM
jgi:hypothetical protein